MINTPLGRKRPPPLEPHSRIGRYELIAPLGSGGMASVFLARGVGHAGFERLAALKVLHETLCADQEFIERFLDEARVAARLHHPNTAAIIDVGADGPRPYMVMDYVEGDTLHAVQCAAIDEGHDVPLGVALRIVLDALAGLDAAHELRGNDGVALGLIHRDVSPHNVLVGVDGVARLVDFGIARAASRRRRTLNGVVHGNAPFMAPEQIRGREIDRRADVFAMGVTLWETLTLTRCFPAREGADAARFAAEEYRPLGEFAPRAPAALDVICRRALACEPADRYATASAFAAAIEAALGPDVATQRELAQFMEKVAAEKVKREREAVRGASQPLPDRWDGTRAPAKPTANHRGRFATLALPAHPTRPLTEAPGLDEVPTAAAATRVRPNDRVGAGLWRRDLRERPARSSTRRFGAAAVEHQGGSLYEALTLALFRRVHPAQGVAGAWSEAVTQKLRALRDPFAGGVTRRVVRGSVRPSARPPPAPTGLDGPTVPRLALRRKELAALMPPPPPPAGLRARLGALVAMVARLWWWVVPS